MTDRLLGGGTRLLAYLGGLILVLLMFYIVVAVFMRYVVGAPLFGAQDLAQMALATVVFLGIAYCGWTGGHIAVDLVTGALPRVAQRVIETAVRLMCAVIMLFMAYQIWRYALDALEYGDATNLLFIPTHPFLFVAAGGIGLYAVVLVVQAVRAARDRIELPQR